MDDPRCDHQDSISVLRRRHSSCTALLASAEELEVSFTLSMQFCSSKGTEKTKRAIKTVLDLILALFFCFGQIYYSPMQSIRSNTKWMAHFVLIGAWAWSFFNEKNISGVVPLHSIECFGLHLHAQQMSIVFFIQWYIISSLRAHGISRLDYLISFVIWRLIAANLMISQLNGPLKSSFVRGGPILPRDWIVHFL